MTAIVNDYIEGWYFFPEALPEIPVGLVTNEHAHRLCFIRLATRFNIDAIYFTARPEITLPHLQTATAVNSNLQDVNLMPTESRKVSIIILEIMIEFPDSPPFPMFGEIFQEWVSLVWQAQRNGVQPGLETQRPVLVTAPHSPKNGSQAQE